VGDWFDTADAFNGILKGEVFAEVRKRWSWNGKEISRWRRQGLMATSSGHFPLVDLPRVENPAKSESDWHGPSYEMNSGSAKRSI
jgi:hypothetical protein